MRAVVFLKMSLVLSLSMVFCRVWAGDLESAPAPFRVEDKVYTPIDIKKVESKWIYQKDDVWSATATLEFKVKAPGHPIFLFSPEKYTQVTEGGNSVELSVIKKDDRELKVMNLNAIPEKIYRVTFGYQFKITERNPFYFQYPYWDGRFFESYIPSNLMFDRYKLKLDLDITNMTEFDTVVSNGNVVQKKRRFHIEFPKNFTAGSFFIDLIDSKKTSLFHSNFNGTLITVYKDPAETVTEEELKNSSQLEVPKVLKVLEEKFGKYSYKSAIVKYANDLFAFAGGITFTRKYDNLGDLLSHELSHSWFLRGVHPRGGAEVWIGEGFGTWVQRGYRRADNIFDEKFKGCIGCVSEYSDLEVMIDADNNGHYGGEAFLMALDKLLEEKGGAAPVLKAVFKKKKFKTITNEEFQKLLERETGLDLEALFQWYIKHE